MNELLKFGLGRAENIVVKVENTGYQHFLLFQRCFLKASTQGTLRRTEKRYKKTITSPLSLFQCGGTTINVWSKLKAFPDTKLNVATMYYLCLIG